MDLRIIEFLENFAKDFIFDSGCQLKKGIHAKLIFSATEGMVVHPDSDEEFAQFLQMKYSTLSFLILEGPKDPEVDLFGNQNASISEEEKERVHMTHPGEKFHAVDPIAYCLWSSKILNATTVELNVMKRESNRLPAGLTTAHFRYPHLLKDLMTRYGSERQSEEAKICLLGPGLLEQEKSSPSFPLIYPSCPQFVELLSLFPKAHFLLLDNDPKGLETLRKYCSICKLMSYDPLTFRIFSDTVAPINQARAPAHYQPLFKEIKEGLSGQALKPAPKEALQLLEGYGRIQPLLVKVDPNKVNVEEFDILSSSMEGMGLFNVIVATFSISIAIEIETKRNADYNPLPQLLKILQALKEGGSLYIDKPGLDRLLLITANHLNSTLDELIEQIESRLGNKLEFTQLPLSDYLKGSLSDLGLLPNFLISTVDQEGIASIGTASITVLTRTHEKTALVTE